MAFELARFLTTDRIRRLQNEVEAKYAASRGRCYVPSMAPLPHVNEMTYERLIRDNPDLSPRIKKSFLLFADLMNVSRFRPVTPLGQLLWDEHVRAYDKAVSHTYSVHESLERGRRRVQEQLDLLYSGKVYPRLNWSYPIIATGILALSGVAIS